MYNGIGLQTARGSGTNGHVQRNWASVKPFKDKVKYRTDEDIAKLEATSIRQPNKGILDHERKRKIEVKCTELEDLLEEQGLPKADIIVKVMEFRTKMTMLDDPVSLPQDEFGRVM
ncbi:serine/arginine repetitive matrix protein 2-like [Ctenocephalides felis]|uniref:serine/arginine repetitive matrix protein 2-like n=1 Tax=Ctenocephalides felis TaxID=7515 RepID=UPI000E6E2BF2|nr:serine/arginine repetitive matrix protein 2-like [Ctenocephalides felis]